MEYIFNVRYKPQEYNLTMNGYDIISYSQHAVWSSTPLWQKMLKSMFSLIELKKQDDEVGTCEAEEFTPFTKEQVEFLEGLEAKYPLKENGGRFINIASLWPSEERIDLIGSNGNTGEHYKEGK